MSPPLEWSGVPEGTAELAIQCEDRDAPGGFVHWLLAGIPPSTTGLDAGEVPPGAIEGRNDFGDVGYGGPRPPIGDPAHRYFFTIHAASEPLGLSRGAKADDLRRALEGRELARGTMVGLYQR